MQSNENIDRPCLTIFNGSASYMISWLFTHELLDHGLNDGIELGLDIRVVEVPAHLILIS